MPVKPEEAEQWLTQLFDDIINDPTYKYGEDQFEHLEWEIRRYDSEHQ